LKQLVQQVAVLQQQVNSQNEAATKKTSQQTVIKEQSTTTTMDNGKGDGGGKRSVKSAQKSMNGKDNKGTTDDKRTMKAKADPPPPGGGGESSSSAHGKLKTERKSRREKRGARKVRRRKNASDSESSQGELSLRSILELYKNTLHNVRVNVVLDSMYPAVMAAWERLRKQHPLPWRVVRTVLPQAFEGRAAALYEEVTAEHLDATEEVLLAQLKVRLYNPQQVSITRGKYERAAQE
jgi:hypothetical protein